MKTRALLACLALAPALSSPAQLVINELMQSNIDLLMDDLNEFPDSWVELYNAGPSPVNLAEYSILDKDKPAKAFPLPSASLPAGGHYVIYCDKEDKGRHASFRLESGKGCNVYLFHNGEKADAVEGLKKQPAPGIAYGRTTSGASEWGYQLVATPGEANAGGASDILLPDPVFSVAGRVSRSPLTLSVSVPDGAPEGTVVRYTTDGSEPTASSRIMTNGISISKTTVVRARLFCEGCLSPRSVAQSYIFHPRNVSIPVVSMTGNAKYFFDRNIGILVEGSKPYDPNYSHDWRRPVNIEIFYPDAPDAAVVNQLIETRVKGGASRGAALKSLVLYANKRFGTKRLEYEFFPDDAPGLTDWKSLELRNAGNDFDYLYFRDAAIQRVMGRNVDIDWQPYMPAVFYLNGEYKGMLNIRTRSNEDHIYTFYDGLEDIDMFENWWELKEGDAAAQEEFAAFYAGHGHTFAQFDERMDVGEFCNLMLMNLYHVNLDFPGNNIVHWRPQAEGGRWRWVAKDTDFGLGLYDRDYKYKTLDWIHNNAYDPENSWANTPDATRLFRRLLETQEFKDMFIDRAAIYMGDFLNRRGHDETIDLFYARIKDEYPHHRALFNPWWPDYNTELTKAKAWVSSRTDFFYQHVADFFSLGSPRPLSIDADRSDDLVLTLNGIPLNYRSFDGQWFTGRPLRLSALSSDGTMQAVGWTVTVTTPAGTTVTDYDTPELLLNMPGSQKVVISSKVGLSSIGELEAPSDTYDPSLPMEIFDLAGRSLGAFASEPSLAPGLYIIRQNSHIFKRLF